MCASVRLPLCYCYVPWSAQPWPHVACSPCCPSMQRASVLVRPCAPCVRSFGIILWEILTLEIPYATEITTKPGEELGRDRMDRLIFSLPARVPEGLRPILPAKAKELNGPPLLPDPEAAEQLYQGIKQLIERCWSATPSDRPTMEEVANVLSSALTTIEESHALRVAQAQAARRATAAAPAPAAAAAPVQG